MPFKFGLRKGRRYEVSSKNSYLVCVHLLDSTLIECTLTADSLGQDCLDNLALRIGLGDTQYFGLRYVVARRLSFSWVDLHKPLKKQLDKVSAADKNSSAAPLLYMAVIFYVADPCSIRDDAARYQYYLHLKTDLKEGKLGFTAEQAVLLAAYSVQAELGDYDPERHGLNYLNDFILLPRSTDEAVSRQVMADVSLMHQQLYGVSQATAEQQYILLTQQLEGYGLDYYPVKDSSSNSVHVGVSFVGVFVKPLSGPTVYFKWADIVSFSHNRRQFGIETTLSEKPFCFYLEDGESAKYLFKLCTWQQLFHRLHAQNASLSPSSEGRDSFVQNTRGGGSSLTNGSQPPPTFDSGQSSLQASPDNQPYEEYQQISSNDSVQTVIINESLVADQSQFPDNQSLSQFPDNQSQSQFLDNQSQSSFQHHCAPDTLSQSSSQKRYPVDAQSQTSLHPADVQSLSSLQQLQQRQRMELHQSLTSLQHAVIQPGQSWTSLHHDPVQRVSSFQLAGVRPLYAMVPSNDHASPAPSPLPLARIPSYRPTPDYETVMRQRALDDAVTAGGWAPHPPQGWGRPYYPPDPLSYSQPDIHQSEPLPPLAHQYLYGGVRERGGGLHYDAAGLQQAYQPSRPVDRSCSLTIYPGGGRAVGGRPLGARGLGGRAQYVTASRGDDVASSASNLRHQSPPPRYPPPSGWSSSTPDLALMYHPRAGLCAPGGGMGGIAEGTGGLGEAAPLRLHSRLDASMDNLTLCSSRPGGMEPYSGGRDPGYRGGRDPVYRGERDPVYGGRDPGYSGGADRGYSRHMDQSVDEFPRRYYLDQQHENLAEAGLARSQIAAPCSSQAGAAAPYNSHAGAAASYSSHAAVLRKFEQQQQQQGEYYIHEGRSVPLSAQACAEVHAFLTSMAAGAGGGGGGADYGMSGGADYGGSEGVSYEEDDGLHGSMPEFFAAERLSNGAANAAAVTDAAAAAAASAAAAAATLTAEAYGDADADATGYSADSSGYGVAYDAGLASDANPAFNYQANDCIIADDRLCCAADVNGDVYPSRTITDAPTSKISVLPDTKQLVYEDCAEGDTDQRPLLGNTAVSPPADHTTVNSLADHTAEIPLDTSGVLSAALQTSDPSSGLIAEDLAAGESVVKETLSSLVHSGSAVGSVTGSSCSLTANRSLNNASVQEALSHKSNRSSGDGGGCERGRHGASVRSEGGEVWVRGGPGGREGSGGAGSQSCAQSGGNVTRCASEHQNQSATVVGNGSVLSHASDPEARGQSEPGARGQSEPGARGPSQSASNKDHPQSVSMPTQPSVEPRDERRRLLESRLAEGQVFAEFEQIAKKRTKYDCATAMREGNKNRNRFKDVLPYEDNRVRLTPSKVNPDGYINASHIKMRVLHEEFQYIAAQGPLPDTVTDFWQMVWEREVEVIAMLTGLEDEKKCAKYWPDRIGPQGQVKFGDYHVTLKHRNVSSSYVTSVLCVRGHAATRSGHAPTQRERLVWHLQFSAWPDNGCPHDTHTFLDYLDELEAVRRQVALDVKRGVGGGLGPVKGGGRSTPVLVHCSAGVGRTGVLILADLMKASLEYNQKVDVPSMLRLLREERMYLVQTVSQYSCVYQLLLLYLQSSRLI